MKNCIFCKIADGDLKVIKIWEDKKYVAFLDMYPVTKGHTIITPKKHTEYVFDLGDVEYSKLMLEAKKIAKLLKEKTKSKKVGVIIEGFGVPHAHVHLIPINKEGDVIGPQIKDVSEAELKKIAKVILK